MFQKEESMNSKEWREWFVRNPFGTDSEPILSDLAAVEKERDEYWNLAVYDAIDPKKPYFEATKREELESTLSRLREALERAIDGEHPEGLNKHHYVLPEGNPTRPEEFAFCEGVTEMAYEVHCILSAIFDEPKENEGKIQALVAASNRVRKAIRELSLEELDDALSPFEEVKT
jgi:hypothetical protein